VAVSFRKAVLADIATLQALIADSAWGLSRADYSDAQIEAALQSAWGVDSQLIRDRTYWVAECGANLVACGGWGWRRTLFGGDAQAGRDCEALDPTRDAARIRAFFVHPAWARRGLGSQMLAQCERDARADGFRSLELVATLPGERFYRVRGYVSQGAREFTLPQNQTMTFVPMRKGQF
jgi:GNAT superfamily N-acetyltransferase